MIVSHLLLILRKKIQFYIFMFEAWNVAKGRKVQEGRILSQGTVYIMSSINGGEHIRCTLISCRNNFSRPIFQFLICYNSLKYTINVVPLHDCVPLVVDSSQKNTVLYLYVWSLKCGKRSQSSRGPNTFARHCIPLDLFHTLLCHILNSKSIKIGGSRSAIIHTQYLIMKWKHVFDIVANVLKM